MKSSGSKTWKSETDSRLLKDSVRGAPAPPYCRDAAPKKLLAQSRKARISLCPELRKGLRVRVRGERGWIAEVAIVGADAGGIVRGAGWMLEAGSWKLELECGSWSMMNRGE